MKAILYLVSVDGASAIEGAVATTTLKEAMTIRKGEGPDGIITRIETADLPLRQLLACVYNREGFAARSTVLLPANERKVRRVADPSAWRVADPSARGRVPLADGGGT